MKKLSIESMTDSSILVEVASCKTGLEAFEILSKGIYPEYNYKGQTESVTIMKSGKNWYKKFNDYEEKYTRISKAEALESIENARKKGIMFNDDNENKDIALFGYWN